jgi:hypothetical protein
VATGLLAAAAFLAIARGWRIGPRAAGALTVALVLSALITPSLPLPPGLPWDRPVMASGGLSLALPLCGLIWWLAFAPKALSTRDLPILLVFPTGFLAQAMLRHLAFGQSPDPLLTAPWFPATLTLIVLAALVAAALLGLARLLAPRAP